MKDMNMKTPVIIIVCRLFLILMLAAIVALGKSMGFKFNITAWAVFLMFVVICTFAFAASFLKTRGVLWFLAISLVVMPLAFWLWFDTSGEIHGVWWEWLIGFAAQMIIPVSLSYSLLTNKLTRCYYIPVDLKRENK
jgi:hypothetical protein